MEQFRGTEAPVDRFALISRRPDVVLLVAWRHVWPWCVGWIVTSAIIYAGILAVDHPLALIIRDRTELIRAIHCRFRQSRCCGNQRRFSNGS
jgi:hypothetical protein